MSFDYAVSVWSPLDGCGAPSKNGCLEDWYCEDPDLLEFHRISNALSFIETNCLADQSEKPSVLCALAERYFEGRGVEKNCDQAVELYQAAAALGSMDAFFALGECYASGLGVRRNLARSFEFYRRAAELGHSAPICSYLRKWFAEEVAECKALEEQKERVEREVTLLKIPQYVFLFDILPRVHDSDLCCLRRSCKGMNAIVEDFVQLRVDNLRARVTVSPSKELLVDFGFDRLLLQSEPKSDVMRSIVLRAKQINSNLSEEGMPNCISRCVSMADGEGLVRFLTNSKEMFVENIRRAGDYISSQCVIFGAIPSEIKQFPGCRSIVLPEKMLSTIPKELGELQALTTLDVRNNQLFEIPAEIGNLQALRFLDLMGNLLVELPREIGNLKALNSLNVSQNFLMQIPAEIGKMQTLFHLFSSNNMLTEIPAEIGNIKTLTVLNLSNNQLTALPAEIGNLQTLETLDVSGNQLTVLPAEIGNLQALTNLNASNNRLMVLHDGIGSLQELTGLSVRNNQLENIPCSIVGLQRLVDFDLRGNKLSVLPAEISKIKRLKKLDLRDNRLTVVPVKLTDRKTLNCSVEGNPIEAWPQVGSFVRIPAKVYQAMLDMIGAT